MAARRTDIRAVNPKRGVGMSKKKKNKKQNHISGSYLSEEEWSALLDKYNCDDEYMFFCEPEEYGGKKIKERNDCGYESNSIAVEAYNDKDSIEAGLYLVEYDGVYYIWMSPSVCNGSDNAFDVEVCSCTSLKDAEGWFDNMLSSNIPSLKKQAEKMKEKVSCDLYFKSFDLSGFRIYYKHLLIMEHVFEFSEEQIRGAIENLHSFEKEKQIKINELYKPGREWNSNQRYYVIGGSTEYEDFLEEVHIPSKTQGRYREPVNVIRDANIDFLSITKERAEKMKEYKKEQEEKEKMVQNGEHLKDEEKRSLKAFLLEKLNKDGCDGTLRFTEEWISRNAQNRREIILTELELGGGYCDCEVIMNYF